MTLQERRQAYMRAFPQWPASFPWVAQEQGREVLYALWKPGPNYRNETALYGAYPPRLLERLWALFPDFVGARVLHAFSGSLPVGAYVRLDINPERQPDVLGDACAPPFAPASFDLVFADPPYSPSDAAIYGTPMVDRKRATRALATVTRPGGFLVWLDTTWPMHQKAVLQTDGQLIIEPDEWETNGKIGMVRSTNHRLRMVSIFQRVVPFALPSPEAEAFICGQKP